MTGLSHNQIIGYLIICYYMEGDVENKPKTSLNDTQPTDECTEIVASKISQFGKWFKIPDDYKKDDKRR